MKKAKHKTRMAKANCADANYPGCGWDQAPSNVTQSPALSDPPVVRTVGPKKAKKFMGDPNVVKGMMKAYQRG